MRLARSFKRRMRSIKECALLAISLRLAVAAIVLLTLSLDSVPVHQLDRRRQHAHEVRPLHSFEPLAAARGHVVLRRAELHRLAAGRLEYELVEPAAHQPSAHAHAAI